MQDFAEWLDARLAERGWTAADLVRASRDPDHPRGFDPGLVSRWRKPAPFGVVPSRATLRRIAAALGVSAGDAFRAAGFVPEEDAPVVDAEQRAREQVNAKRAAIRAELERWLDAVGPEYESLFWDSLKVHGETTVQTIQSVQTAVSQTPHTAVSPGVRRARTATNGDPSGGNSPLAKEQPHAGARANHPLPGLKTRPIR